jgi:hypothetical protein
VVHRLMSSGHKVFVRANLKSGAGGLIPASLSEFRFHPNNAIEATDVAVCLMSREVVAEDDESKKDTIDCRWVPLNGDRTLVASDQEIKDLGIGIGDEVVVVGLFRSHYGLERNVPIVRIGNIASMREEPVFTKYAGDIEAYLVEARSIGGLSGSPVFVARSASNVPGFVLLLGMMHGHFDVRSLNEDVVTDDDASDSGIHTGIGVVIPVHKIIETVEHPDLNAMRQARAEKGEG